MNKNQCFSHFGGLLITLQAVLADYPPPSATKN